MTPSTAVLAAGYVLAVPFTLFPSGFLRLWRRREPWAYAAAQGGAALVVAGWAAKGNVPAAAVNVAWLVGFGAAYGIHGRRRTTSAG